MPIPNRMRWTPHERMLVRGGLESHPLKRLTGKVARSATSIRRQLAAEQSTETTIRRDAHGLGAEELAAALGVTPGAAAAWMYRGRIPVVRVPIGLASRIVLAVDPEILVPWLEDRGALYRLAPTDLAWQEIVAAARITCLSRYLPLRLVLAAAGISRTGLHYWRQQLQFPDPAIQLYGGGGSWVRRSSIRAWCAMNPRWASHALVAACDAHPDSLRSYLW